MNFLKRKKEIKIKVEIYSKPDCYLCDNAKTILLKAQKNLPFNIEEVDITQNKELFEQYKEQIPVVFINGRKAFKFRVNEKALQKQLKELL